MYSIRPATAASSFMSRSRGRGRTPGDRSDALSSFLRADFLCGTPRIVVAGDAAKIAEVARNGFDLIIMPTHAGTFRRMLLGSTTAKVLNDADAVVTSRHVETIAPRPLAHREWLCAIGLEEGSERVLRYAHQIAKQAQADPDYYSRPADCRFRFTHSNGRRRANSIRGKATGASAHR